jgi:cytochrome P450 family 4
VKTIETFGRPEPQPIRTWALHMLEILVYDYKTIETILTNQKFLSKSTQYNYLKRILGEGLLFSTNQKWFDRRRIITPTFHFKILEQFFEVFKKQNLNLIKSIKEKPNGSPFNIYPIVTTSVLNSLCKTALGYGLKAQDIEYLNAVKEMSIHIAETIVSPTHRIKFIFDRSEAKKAQDRCAKIMSDFTSKVIEERRKTISDGNQNVIENLDDNDVGLKKKMCLLDVLLQSTIDNKPLTNADIQEEVDNFTFAGHDTTKNAISFTLFMISKYPEVQQKLVNEINEILGEDELTFKRLNDFKYLEMVIRETMRLYPPVPIISRRLFEEVDFGSFIAPANANYNLLLFMIFRDPKVFKNPDDFIPERFSEELPAFAFTPFSAVSLNFNKYVS